MARLFLDSGVLVIAKDCWLSGGDPESLMSIAAGDVGAVHINDRLVGYDLYVSSLRFGEIRQKLTIEANKVTVVPLPEK